MRVEPSDDGGEPTADGPDMPGIAVGLGQSVGDDASGSGEPGKAGKAGDLGAVRTEYRAKVDGASRAYAIDQGCARVEKIEDTIVTPAMRCLEAEDPCRRLVGLDHRLKGRDRLAEKVDNWMRADAELTYDRAFGMLKDAIRYTFQYSDAGYSDGVHADIRRLRDAGFELVDSKNSWNEAEYKGINSRWRVPENGQLFEVQFHSQASYEAKQLTHAAYERIRDPSTPPAQVREMRAFQREVTTRIPIPPGAPDIPDFP
jgi:hypothetical protein